MSPGSHANNQTGNDVDAHLMLLKTYNLRRAAEPWRTFNVKGPGFLYVSLSHLCSSIKAVADHVVFNEQRTFALSQGRSSDYR